MTLGREQRERVVDVASTILLTVAAVATAWCTYQASRWNAERVVNSGHTTSLRGAAERAQALAEAQNEVDVATFIAWVDAYKRGDTDLADFYFRRFRKEFKPAVVAWLATKPLTNRNARLTPFAMPQYRLAATAEYERLDAEAKASSPATERDMQRSTNYVLGVVLFAVSLFFGGISTKVPALWQQEVLLGVGWVIFLSTAVFIATSPISLGNL